MNDPKQSRRVLIISPCRDEAEFLETTIRTVAAQTLRPSKWIIVDDGSTDGTPEILERAAKEHAFIEVVRRDERKERVVGPGVVDAFYDGLSRAELRDFDYVCKLDCDLELPPRYFERCVEHFEDDPWLGTVSGKLFGRHGGRLVEERTGDENSVGPAKLYRVECFQDIGGFVREVCWDGIDGHMCRVKGWIARSLHDPEMQIIHLRQMGSSHVGIWTGRQRWGKGKYFMGSAPYYVVAVAAYRMFERPFVLGGAGILWGYLQAMAKRHPRFEHAEYRKHLAEFERTALVFGKRKATERLESSIRERPPKSRSGSES